jgi:hypothetical protein
VAIGEFRSRPNPINLHGVEELDRGMVERLMGWEVYATAGLNPSLSGP